MLHYHYKRKKVDISCRLYLGKLQEHAIIVLLRSLTSPKQSKARKKNLFIEHPISFNVNRKCLHEAGESSENELVFPEIVLDIVSVLTTEE